MAPQLAHRARDSSAHRPTRALTRASSVVNDAPPRFDGTRRTVSCETPHLTLEGRRESRQWPVPFRHARVPGFAAATGGLGIRESGQSSPDGTAASRRLRNHDAGEAWIRSQNRPPAAAANQGTAACSIGTPRLDCQSSTRSIPAAKSALRRRRDHPADAPPRSDGAIFSTRRTVLRHITCDMTPAACAAEAHPESLPPPRWPDSSLIIQGAPPAAPPAPAILAAHPAILADSGTRDPPNPAKMAAFAKPNRNRR